MIKRRIPFQCLPFYRLPPSDLHVQQAQNSPRLMSVNLPTACPRTLKIGGIHRKRTRALKLNIQKV